MCLYIFLQLFVRLIVPSIWLGIIPIEMSIVIILKTKFMTTIALRTDQRRFQVVPQKAKLTCKVDLRHFCLKGREFKKRRRSEQGRLGTLSAGPNLPDLVRVPLEHTGHQRFAEFWMTSAYCPHNDEPFGKI